jgi:hypothetical protein
MVTMTSIAWIRLRAQLATRLVESVRSSLSSRRPWIITPTGLPETILPGLMEKFEPLAAKQKIGLVDTFTFCEALRLKTILEGCKARVHIWTNDRRLKGQEPDAEQNPYFW